jgi:Protein of unknown function (DUF3160).
MVHNRPLLVILIALLLLQGCQFGQQASNFPTPSAEVAPTTSSEANELEPTSSSNETNPSNEPAELSGVIPSLDSIAPIAAVIPANYTAGSSKGRFADYPKPKPLAEPKSSGLTIAPDLSNVQVAMIISEQQRQQLGQHGFVISPDTTKEFYEVYERARYNFEPTFITSDSLLHVYHLLFDKTLRQAERNSFIPMLTRLDWELLRSSVAQAEALADKDPAWAEAARRNAAYFAVAVKLLDPSWEVPAELRDLTDPDLAAIAAHDSPGPSAIFPNLPLGEDWTQYVPRGHYTQSPELENYFRAMMWHGRMTMRASDPLETRQAALLTMAWRDTKIDGMSARDLWDGIYQPTVFFVGRSDDLMPIEYQSALESAYGSTQSPTDLLDAAKFESFQKAVSQLRPPLILGILITDDMPIEETTKGLRFMGQRFTPDSALMRELIHRNVEGRGLPKGLDIFAVLGSERALEHLEAMGETQFPNYNERMAKLRQQFAAYDEETWTQNLYWSWIYALQPLLEQPDPNLPQFMQSPLWQDKQLNTALGSWTELRRDTILYAKQVYAEGGAGGLPPPVPTPPKGYVEPVPELFARISALGQMTIVGLKERGLLAENDELALNQLVSTADQLATIANKQLAGEQVSDDEYDFIRRYGVTLEGLTFSASDAMESASGGGFPDPEGGEDPQVAVVADVATDIETQQVLEEGVGRVFTIYVVVPIEGQLVLTKGGVFSHYEFIQPMSSRLSDEKWRELLDAGQAPPLEDWKKAMMVEEHAASPLQETVVNFHDALLQSLWYVEEAPATSYTTGAAHDMIAAQIADLRQKNQFVGVYRERIEFRSFDFIDNNNAVVTTREFMREELRQGTVYDEDEPPIVGVRPDYSVDVTYTLVKENDMWLISQIVSNPAFQLWQQP